MVHPPMSEFEPWQPGRYPVTRIFKQHVIHVKNLQLPAGVIAPHIWGINRLQPALISLELALTPGFDSAAGLDALDASTINYGVLCKNVRSACSEAAGVEETMVRTQVAAQLLSFKGKKDQNGKDTTILKRMLLILTLPKASAYGKDITISHTRPYQLGYPPAPPSDVKLTFRELRFMTVIGVNESEREDQQAVVLTAELGFNNLRLAQYFLGLERELIEIVQPHAFETLETLATVSITSVENLLLEQMTIELLGDMSENIISVRLLFEKPSAVIFADAPAIEVYGGIQVLSDDGMVKSAKLHGAGASSVIEDRTAMSLSGSY